MGLFSLCTGLRCLCYHDGKNSKLLSDTIYKLKTIEGLKIVNPKTSKFYMTPKIHRK